MSDIAGARAVVKFFGSCGEVAALLGLGFQEQKGDYVRPVADHPDRQALVRQLINLNALFVGGADWSPAELVRYYRDQKSVEGSFLEVIWRTPERYEVSEA